MLIMQNADTMEDGMKQLELTSTCLPHTIEDNHISSSSITDDGAENSFIYKHNFQAIASHNVDGNDVLHSIPQSETPNMSREYLGSYEQNWTKSFTSSHITLSEYGKSNDKGLNYDENDTYCEVIHKQEIVIKDISPEQELPPTFQLDKPIQDEDFSLLRDFASHNDEIKPKQKEGNTILSKIRKVSVGLTGSAMVIVGIPMIPAPTPGGVVVVGGGMALLATEFPAAGRALDKTRERIAKAVAEDPHDEKESSSENDGSEKILIGDSMPLRHSSRVSVHSNEYMEEVQEVRRKATKAMKGTQRSVKRFIRCNILPIMEKMTQRVNDETKKLSPKRISSMRGSSNGTNMIGTKKI